MKNIKKFIFVCFLVISFFLGKNTYHATIGSYTGGSTIKSLVHQNIKEKDVISLEYYQNLNGSGMKIEGMFCKYLNGQLVCIDDAPDTGVINYCNLTQPTCYSAGNCTLKENPLSKDQAWEKDKQNCGFTCINGYTGDNCKIPPTSPVTGTVTGQCGTSNGQCVTGTLSRISQSTTCGTNSTWKCKGSTTSLDSPTCSYTNSACVSTQVSGVCDSRGGFGCDSGFYEFISGSWNPWTDPADTTLTPPFCGTTFTRKCRGSNPSLDSGKCTFVGEACVSYGYECYVLVNQSLYCYGTSRTTGVSGCKYLSQYDFVTTCKSSIAKCNFSLNEYGNTNSVPDFFRDTINRNVIGSINSIYYNPANPIDSLNAYPGSCN